MEFSLGSSYPSSFLALLESDQEAQSLFSALPPWAQAEATAANFASTHELRKFSDSLHHRGKL